MKAQVTVTVAGKVVALDRVTDQRIRAPFETASSGIVRQLGAVRCPVHRKAPTHLRLHFDAGGGVDLRYESCCPELGKAVQQKLG